MLKAIKWMANSNNQHVCMSNVYDKFWCHKRESIVFIEKWHKPTMEDNQCTDYFKFNNANYSPNNNEFLWFSVKLVFFGFFRMDWFTARYQITDTLQQISTNHRYNKILMWENIFIKFIAFKKHDKHKWNWEKKFPFLGTLSFI